MKEKQIKTQKAGKRNPFKTAARAIITFKWGYLLFAVMFIVAGVAFLAHPLEATEGVSVAVGIVAVAFSVIAMVFTMSDKNRGFRFWAKMVTTVLGIVTGIVVIILACNDQGSGVFRVLVLLLAVYLIIDGSFKLQTTILSHRYKFWLWWVMLVFVAAEIVLGVLALYNGSAMKTMIVEHPKLIPSLAGIGFIIDGILNFLSIIFLYIIENGQRKEVIRDLEERGMIATVEDAEPVPAALDGREPVALAPEASDAVIVVSEETIDAEAATVESTEE